MEAEARTSAPFAKRKEGNIKKNYTWQEFDEDIKTIAKLFKEHEYDEIYGIPRGGLVIAVVLSHRFNLPLSLESHPDKKVLVVDDICDSGRTISKFKAENLRTLTIFLNTEHAEYFPNFWVRTTKDWIIFPWETAESSKYDNVYN